MLDCQLVLVVAGQVSVRGAAELQGEQDERGEPGHGYWDQPPEASGGGPHHHDERLVLWTCPNHSPDQIADMGSLCTVPGKHRPLPDSDH